MACAQSTMTSPKQLDLHPHGNQLYNGVEVGERNVLISEKAMSGLLVVNVPRLSTRTL